MNDPKVFATNFVVEIMNTIVFSLGERNGGLFDDRSDDFREGMDAVLNECVKATE